MSAAPSPVPPAATSQAVNAEHPWPGLAYFTEETRAFFFGREEEIAELARRIRRKNLTVLFGQSGLGKTSILRAGIVPRLRPEGFCPVYVRIDYDPDAPSPSEQIKQAIFRATLASGQWTRTGVAREGESLWEFLHHRDDILRDADGRVLVPLLIFDQFEEIFTLAQHDEFGRRRAAQFIEDLADLVENRAPKELDARMDSDEAAGEKFDFSRSDYRVLIALREDYLAHLEGLRVAMPSIGANRMRLARMNGAQALEAVRRPGGALVPQEVAEAIVRFVAGGAELPNAEVEPSLLSLICLELNNARLAQGRSEIGTDLLAGSHASILSEFYERTLADQPAGVRRVIEDDLLTEGGFRESLAEERLLRAFAAVGAGPGTLSALVNRRLLRVEERLDVRRVELTHDVLCSVVKGSRDVRLQREAKERAERDLLAQRERERNTRHALHRARRIAVGCLLLAAVAVAGALFGYVNMQRAQHTREIAETARGQAENLVVYLLDDFQLELEPVGRLDVVGGLAKRAIDYYAALPPELRDEKTARNQALAQVRNAVALRLQGRLDESQKNLDPAIATLGRLVADGDKSELTAIGLAEGHVTRGLLMGLHDQYVAGAKEAESGVAVLKPLAEAGSASSAVLRAYAASLDRLGFMLMRDSRFGDAKDVFEHSRAVYRSVANLSEKDIPAMVGYLEPTAWLVEDLGRLGQSDAAVKVGSDAMPIAEKVLALRPGHLTALRSMALTYSNLALAEVWRLHWAGDYKYAVDAQRTWEKMLQVDPGNQISRYNHLIALSIQSEALEHLGRFREVLQINERIDAEADTMVQTPDFDTDRAGGRFSFAIDLEDLGDDAGAVRMLARGREFAQRAVRGLAPGSFQAGIFSRYDQWSDIRIEELRGHYAQVLARAPAAAESIAAIKPENGQDRDTQCDSISTLYSIAAESAFALGDMAHVEEYGRQAVQVALTNENRTVGDNRRIDDARILRAIAQFRLGRAKEARDTVAAVISRQRRLLAGSDDQMLRVELARGLYALGEIDPQARTASLTEARALIRSVPSEMRALKSTAFWEDHIENALRDVH
jgi:tetratricopeptide (TPR) repeat protein